MTRVMAGNAPRLGGPMPMRQTDPAASFGVADMAPTAIAQGLQGLGQGMQRFAANMEAFQHRVATTAAEEALVAFEREKNAAFYDPESGYFNTQGRTAYDNAKPMVENLEKARQKYADTLESEDAREMFNRAAGAQLTRAQTDVMRHASTQFDAWERSTIAARVENSLENAVAHWNDPDAKAVQLEVGRQSVIDLGMANGDSPEAIAEAVQSFNSSFAVATIDAALQQSGAAAAQAALADNTLLLEAPDLIKAQARIDIKFKTEAEQAQSATAVTMAGTMVQTYGDAPNARTLIQEQVNFIEDGDLRGKVLREANYQLDTKLRADSEARAQTFEAAETFMLENGSVDQFIAADPEGWANLHPDQKKKLMAGTAVTTTYETLSRLMLLPPAELAKVNPSDYFAELAPADRNRLISAVNSARSGSPEGQIGRSRTQQITGAVNQLFPSLGSGTSPGKKAERQEKINAFYQMFDAEVIALETQRDAPLTSAEFTEVLNGFTRRVAVEKDWWFGTRETDITEIPPTSNDEVRGIVELSELLRLRNLPVTADNLIKLHRQVNQ